MATYSSGCNRISGTIPQELILSIALSKYSLFISTPIEFLPAKAAAIVVLKEPDTGSNTVPLGGHPSWMNFCNNSTGFDVGCHFNGRVRQTKFV